MPPTEPSQPEQVFLSYSSTDRETCIALRATLEKGGLSAFHDVESLRAGGKWMEELQKAIDSCSAFVVLIGRDGVRRWVGAEAQAALNRHFGAHDDKRLPIFPILLGNTAPDTLPAFLPLFQATAWNGTDPLPRPLLDAIRDRAIVANTALAIEGCPFVGLDAYRSDQAHLFFGRQKETLDALACFDTRTSGATVRWLEINGNSGSGKSSLMNAGLLPLVDRGWLWPRTGHEHWRRIGPMMPGEHPVVMLAEHLSRAFGIEMADVRKRLEESDERALADWLRTRKQSDRNAFLLAIDQFEELFTFADPKQRARFDSLLATALADSACPFFVISTVRGDFLDRFEDLPRLRDARNRLGKCWTLSAIGGEGLREVIDGPARLADLDVSEAREVIVSEALDEPGALPLVENALRWLWGQRQPDPRSGKPRLSGKLFTDHGGLAGILSTQADALLERIGGEVTKGKQAALELLLRLTRINDEGRHTRQRVTREEAIMVAGDGNDANGERVVRMLSGERALDVPTSEHGGALRLITTSTERGKQFVDLIHETLIRPRTRDETTGKRVGYWPTLYDYIEKNRDRDFNRQQLKFQTEQWLQNKGLGRLRNLAGWRDLRLFRRLRIPKLSDETRFLSWSRWKTRAQLGLLALLIAFVGESYLWTRKHDLPLDSMVMQQRYRLGYAPVPTMKMIQPGPFDLGEQDQEFRNQYRESDRRYWGAPLKKVQIAKPFWISIHEVTYAEYDYYVWLQQRSGNPTLQFPTTAKGGRSMRPVVNLNWREATNYAAWLGKRLGQACRLPTEVEWEYAARGGTKTAYWWGDEIESNNANCRDCGERSDGTQSLPVGSFRPNPFGLYDTQGNVWEWTCSAWQDEFDGSEELCVDAKSAVARVVRGGGWSDDADRARSAARLSLDPDYRFDDLGFRVLCSSPIE